MLFQATTLMLQLPQYRKEDHDEVWNLHNTALNEIGAHAGNGPWDDDLHKIEEVYIRLGGEFLVGIINNEIVAMSALKRTNNLRAQITRMSVKPGYQRQGYGRTILLELERRAKELGFRFLHLDTTVQQISAQKLYEQHGYTEVRRGIIEGFDCIFYEKKIG